MFHVAYVFNTFCVLPKHSFQVVECAQKLMFTETPSPPIPISFFKIPHVAYYMSVD